MTAARGDDRQRHGRGGRRGARDRERRGHQRQRGRGDGDPYPPPSGLRRMVSGMGCGHVTDPLFWRKHGPTLSAGAGPSRRGNPYDYGAAVPCAGILAASSVRERTPSLR